MWTVARIKEKRDKSDPRIRRSLDSSPDEETVGYKYVKTCSAVMLSNPTHHMC